jgi:hypothetical protein
VREAVLTNLWLTAESAAAHIRPVSGGKPSWLPDCLLIKSRNVAEYLCTSMGGRVSLANGWLGFLTGWWSRVIPWKLAHAILLGCTI